MKYLTIVRGITSIITILLLLVTTLAVKADDITAQEIPSVSTNSSTTNQSAITTPSNVIIITRQEIQDSGASNISEVLRELTGIQVNDLFGDNSATALSIRGFGDNAASNSLILIDGYRFTNPDLSVPDLNRIPIQEIERIEVIPGSASILYGDQAVGGIINIITFHPMHFVTNIVASYGSYNQIIYGATIGDNLSNGFNYLFNGWINNSDNYRQHNNQDTNNLSGRIGYNYNTGSIFFNYQKYINNLLYAGALTVEQAQQDPRQAQTDTNFSDQNTNIYQAGIKQKMGDNWLLQTGLQKNTTLGSGFIFSPFTERREIDDFNPRILGNIDNNLITTGIDYENDQYRLLNSLSNTNNSQQEKSVFFQIVSPILAKLNLTLGLRDANLSGTTVANDIEHDINNNAFVTEQGLSYQMTRNLRLYVRRESNFRFPKADEEASLPLGVNNLKTQTGVSYEIGTEWYIKNNALKFSIYRLALKNEIAFDPTQTPEQPFGANTNLSPTLRDGMVLTDQYNLTRTLSLLGQYNYVDARFSSGINKGDYIPFVAKNIASIGLNYQFLENYNLYINDTYIGNRYASGDISNVNGILGGYSIYNINLSYQRAKWTLSARVNNLFNKKYNSFTVYEPSSMNDFVYPAPGFNFLLTAKYQIG